MNPGRTGKVKSNTFFFGLVQYNRNKGDDDAIKYCPATLCVIIYRCTYVPERGNIAQQHPHPVHEESDLCEYCSVFVRLREDKLTHKLKL